MKRMCRETSLSLRRRRMVSVLLRHARIVTDPERLAQLYAEAAKRKLYAEAARIGVKPDLAP